MKDYKCGDCRFYCTEKAFEKPCDKLGIIETAKSCAKFKPAVQKFDDALNESEGALDMLGKFMRKIPSSNLHILSSVILNEKVTRKFGYCFMQKVYVRYRGTQEADYLDNFLPCHIMEATKEGLRLLSHDGKTHILKTDFRKGELAGPNIYSISEFKKFRAAMLRSKKLEDPAHKRRKADFSYLVEESKVEKNEKKYTLNDLVTMTRDVEKGYVAKPGYKRERSDQQDLIIGL